MSALPPPQRRVSLRLATPSDQAPLPLPPEALERVLARARTLGLPVHADPQVGGLLAALRLRDDVPTLLYAAAAAVLAGVYDASGESGEP